MHWGTAPRTYFLRLNRLPMVTSVLFLVSSARKLSGLGKIGWLVHQILNLLVGSAQTVWRKKGPSRHSKASRHSSSSSDTQILNLLVGSAQTVWRKKGPSRHSKASRHSSSSSDTHSCRTEPNSSGPQPKICPGLPHLCSRFAHPHGALLPSPQPRCWCAISWGCCQQQ